MGAVKNINDPKGLVRESYAIEGISDAECRSILMDWALSLDGVEAQDAIPVLLAQYGADAPDHPMTALLHEGLGQPVGPRKRRGRLAR